MCYVLRLINGSLLQSIITKTTLNTAELSEEGY